VIMETTAFVCTHVFDNSRPILLVSREEGDWQCMCGKEHNSREVVHVVGLNHLIERDPTLLELNDLPNGWEAERAHLGDPWLRGQVASKTK
jgi:hypothetical protein